MHTLVFPSAEPQPCPFELCCHPVVKYVVGTTIFVALVAVAIYACMFPAQRAFPAIAIRRQRV
jgi:hypothetical protein